MFSKKSPENLDATVAALANRAALPWTEIGDLLLKVEANGAWGARADSYTQWVRGVAASLGKTEASLWRFLSAMRFAKALSAELGVDALFHTGAGTGRAIGAESLELLAKLKRVVPEKEFRAIALRTIQGEASRADLRTVWESYRPALAGRTARGRGKAPVRVDFSNESEMHSVLEAQVLSALQFGDAGWSGVQDPKNFHIFTNVPLPRGAAEKWRLEIDAVVVVKDENLNRIWFHGIDIRGSNVIHLINAEERFTYLARFFHAVWIAISEIVPAPVLYEIPASVGVLRLIGPDIRVERNASWRTEDPEMLGELSRLLLGRALKWV